MKKSTYVTEQLFAIQHSRPASLYEAIKSYVGVNMNCILVLAATKHFYKQSKKRGRK